MEHISCNKNRSPFISHNICAQIQTIIAFQAKALMSCAIPAIVSDFVEKILSCSGHVIFSGIGKSGLIARKLAATFSSVGIPAFFMHPTETLHGDLGALRAQDIFVMLSKSGVSDEFHAIIPVLRRNNICTIFISCFATALTQKADIEIIMPIASEAGELGIVPTTSTLMMLALGDAIALVVSSLRGLSRDDFARYHPAGSLGRMLTATVDMLMQHDNLSLIAPDAPFQSIISIITAKKLGVGIVIDDNQQLCGIITDGDLRRACAQGPEVFNVTAEQIMCKNPHTTSPNIRAQEALLYMESHKITSLVVTDHGKVIGFIHMHDIVQAGIR